MLTRVREQLGRVRRVSSRKPKDLGTGPYHWPPTGMDEDVWQERQDAANQEGWLIAEAELITLEIRPTAGGFSVVTRAYRHGEDGSKMYQSHTQNLQLNEALYQAEANLRSWVNSQRI